MPLRDHADAAVPTTIEGAIDASILSITIADASGWPSGGIEGPFIVTIDHNLSTEERVSIASRTGLTLTVGERGFGGTTASAHTSGAEIFHSWSATEAQESNDHIFGTGDDHLQYMRADGTRHDLTARHEAGTTIPTAAPTTILPDAAAAEGSGIELARATHTHAIGAAVPVAVSTALSEGASTSFARANHVHTLGSGSVATVAQHNDLIRPVVIQEAAPGGPIIGQRWVQPSTRREFMWDGSEWIFSGGRVPTVAVGLSTGQTVSDGGVATMTFGAGDVRHDTDSMANTVNNTCDAPMDGVYVGTAFVSRQANPSFFWGLSITKNGTVNIVANNQTTNTILFGSAITVTTPAMEMSALDNIRARVFNSDGNGRQFILEELSLWLVSGKTT